ncbi:Uncharacterised protein g5665 [Pycnogonum litorale]
MAFKHLLNLTKIHKRTTRWWKISDVVQASVLSGQPLVALESTIITHGMPYPANLVTALEVEDIVRQNGAIPATIGIIKGQVKIGLSRQELEFLSKNNETVKTSRRDLPYVLSKRLNGGTTVSGTMILAHRAGIPVFITGGIGGVHRGCDSSFDISADLTELSRTPITVVSAGVKSILDIPKTLEYLETLGVTVATYGDSTDFPAFFTPKSGCHTPVSINNPRDAAEMIHSRDLLELENGILISVPIPNKDTEAGVCIQNAIDEAVNEAVRGGVTGKKVTPYILKRVNEITKGLSLEFNKLLIKNNAQVGAKIAVELYSLKDEARLQNNGKEAYMAKDPGVVVIGGSNVDYVMQVNDEMQMSGTSLKGSIKKLYGGVGRNLTECISKLCPKNPPLFISAVGRDDNGKDIKADTLKKTFNTTGIVDIQDANTATYCAVLDKEGDCLYGIGDMNIHGSLSTDLISLYMKDIRKASMVVIDGNIPGETMKFVIDECHDKYNVPVWFEPTDAMKAVKPFRDDTWKKITYMSPNFNELVCIHSELSGKNLRTALNDIPTSCEEIIGISTDICQRILEHIPVVIVTIGLNGVILCARHSHIKINNNDSGIFVKHFPPIKVPGELRVSVSGAGDCLAGAIISAVTAMGLDIETSIVAGLKAASLSIQSVYPVPSTIDKGIFNLNVE